MSLPSFGSDNNYSDADKTKVDDLPDNKAYCSFSTQPALSLTSTYQLVTGWTADNVTNIGYSESGGEFTLDFGGLHWVDLERLYLNADNNPSEGVDLYLRIDVNDVTAVERGPVPISAAPSPQDPTSDPLTSPFLVPANAGDKVKIYVRATDGVSEPTAATLEFMKVVARLAYNL